MDIMVVIQTMLKLFIILLIGYALNKFGVFDSYVNKKISSLVVNLTSPLLIIYSISTVDSNNKSAVLLMIGLGFLMYIGFIIFGKLACLLLPFPKKDYPVYECMCVFANTAFMGYPVVQSILGTEAIFYASMIHMAFSIFVYSYGVICVNKSGTEKFKFNAKLFMTPGFILSVLSVVIYVFSIKLPSLVLSTTEMVGSLTSPLSMMMIGSSLAMYPLKESLGDWRSYLFAAVRLLAIPAITALVCSLVHMDSYFAAVTIITNAMPVAATVLMLATEYNSNVELVTRNIVVSTLLSVITIPIIVALFVL